MGVFKTGLVLLALSLSGAASSQEIMSLQDVKKGMQGVGRTVFKGTEIEEFQVEILGVLENTGPRQNLIIARLSGGPMEQTGVIMGMSGSPVYIGDKVIGAVSTAFPFAKEAIAGITPIQEMISTTTGAESGPRSSGASTMPQVFKKMMTLEELASPLRRETSPSPGGVSYIQTPLSFSGLSPGAVNRLTSMFSGCNLVPVAGGSGGGKFEQAIEKSLEPFKPGSAVSVQLVRGDFDLSAVGTVTMVDNGRVYAFGHPFLNMGSIQWPMARAEVISLLPNLYASFKISSTADVVGTVEQDRATAIAGTLGKHPQMIPMNVELETSMGAKEKYRFEIVTDKFLSPILTYITMLSTITSRERQYGDSTLRMVATLNLGAGTSITVGDIFTGGTSADDLASLVATPVYLLLNNPYRQVSVNSIEIVVRSDEKPKTARLERVELDRSTYQPGGTVKMKVHLRGELDDAIVEETELELPKSLKTGDLLFYVGEGGMLDAMDAAELREAYYPQTYPQLIRALNNLRKNNRVYVRLSERRAGIVLRGEDLSDLPPSAAAIIGSRSNTSEMRRIYYSPALDAELPTSYTVSGYRLIQLKIRSS